MFKNVELAQRNGQSATITIGNWFLYDLIGLLNVIPIVGSIASLVIYIMIAVSKQTAPSMRNRCILDLIYSLIIFIVMIIVLVMFGAVIMSAISSGALEDSASYSYSYSYGY